MNKVKDGALIEITGLNKNYDGITALDDVDLSIKKGEVVVILGPSGCGKSTLLRCLNGLEKIQGGDIRFRSKSLAGKDVHWQEIRQHIGMVFQSYDLFPHMTVIENIILGPMKVQKRAKTEVMEQAKQLLDRVGLLDRQDSYPRQLSGGQKQRIAIVRALCMNPDIMLFDEVTASLDPEMVREVLDVILGLAKQGMTMVIVTHEMSFARAVADKIVFIDKGKVCEISEPDVFFENPKTERAQHFLNKFQF
jgi:polar amino acid transport system ATP-binding protein